MLSRQAEAIHRQAPFAELGLDSRSAVALVAALEDHLGGAALDPTLLWQHPTIAALADFLSGADVNPMHGSAKPAAAEGVIEEKATAIAIIGLACRLPGASDAQA